MDRFLRYFVTPIKRVTFGDLVGKTQANSVISKFVEQQYIESRKGMFCLTDKGVDAWQVYVGIKKP